MDVRVNRFITLVSIHSGYCAIYDNRDGGLKPIARRVAPHPLEIVDQLAWSRIEEETKWEL
jgi:hypothetical protein